MRIGSRAVMSAALALVGVAAAVFVVIAGEMFEARLQERWRAERLSELAGLRARLEGELNGATNLTAGLVSYVAARGGISRQDFDLIARELLADQSLLRNITLAPDNVISMVYPMAGNEAAVGLDLLHHPVQGAATRRMLADGRAVLAGPVALVQGGRALIHRVPIHLTPPGAAPRSGRYWGLMSTPIDFDRLLVRSGLHEAELRYQIALRGVDGLGSGGAVFWGDSALFDDPAAFKLDVRVLDGEWNMAAVPLDGVPGLAAAVWRVRAAGAGVALFVLLLLWRFNRVAARLEDSEQLHRELAEQIHDVLFRTDAAGRLSYLNPAWQRLSGRAAEESLGHHWTELLLAEDRAPAAARCARFLAAAASGSGAMLFDERVRIADEAGHIHNLVVRAAFHRGVGGAGAGEGGLVGVMADLTERQALAAQLALAARVFERSGEGIVVFDGEGRIESVNPAFTRLTGYTADEVVGTGGEGVGGMELFAQVRQALGARDHWQGELEARHRGGARFPVTLSATLVRGDHGQPEHCIAIFSDISERRAQEASVRHLALHDGLTGLANRIQLSGRFDQAASLAERDGRGMALLYFDLDAFKPVNDTHGHAVGDEVLRAVASRLRELVRQSDTVARVGGDEFVVLLAQVGGAGDALEAAGKLMDALNAPLLLDSGVFNLGASVGVSLYPQHGRTLDELLRAADRAMYHAKRGSHGLRRIAVAA
ncbi:diguanylate cyclase [Azoarcus sp. TTM-91]|uniref:sensor domain-containing diguanylate cyclase n=1 Tax=Azoarcus sp. TTM-91 TaxID=2691581 RepID=UPI00145E79EA|nr:diguanylate cyclase [Azoarcus sp. TTM-91]